jgi:3-oxoadipate enol-lactonase
MRVKANGITFNCEVSGPDNKPWLIFSNSLATNLHMWDPQAEALKNEFRMLRYDQRGHGLTDAPTSRYTFELLRDDVIALMDTLNIRRAWEERIAVAQRDGMPALLESTMQRWFPPETLKANPPHMDLIRQMILTTPVNCFIGCSAALGDHDFRPLMPKVKNPVLWMTGEKDANNAAEMKVMQAELPDSRYVTSCFPAPATSPTWTSRKCSREICASFYWPDQAALAIAPCWAWRMMPERSP